MTSPNNLGVYLITHGVWLAVVVANNEEEACRVAELPVNPTSKQLLGYSHKDIKAKVIIKKRL